MTHEQQLSIYGFQGIDYVAVFGMPENTPREIQADQGYFDDNNNLVLANEKGRAIARIPENMAFEIIYKEDEHKEATKTP